MDNNAASIPRNPSKAPTRMDTVCFSQPGFWGNIGLIRTIVMASEDATLGRVAFISRSTHSISCGPYISVRSCTNRGYKEFRTCRTDGTRNPHPISSNTNRAPPCDACSIVADVKAVRLAPRAEVPSRTTFMSQLGVSAVVLEAWWQYVSLLTSFSIAAHKTLLNKVLADHC
jgi:hypothetical protein